MYDNFADYMWHLLSTPFKKVKKAVNQWYIWCKVMGRFYDSCKRDLQQARLQSMVATCDDIMLQEHGADRGLVRLAGEDYHNYRVRIINFEMVKKLGGTDTGVLYAVRSLGFLQPEIQLAKVYTGDANRWAEFYLILNFTLDDSMPVSLSVLKKEVRQVKSVGAKDNYVYLFGQSRFENQNTINARSIIKINISVSNMAKTVCVQRFVIENSNAVSATVTINHNVWRLNSMFRLNAQMRLNAYMKEENI